MTIYHYIGYLLFAAVLVGTIIVVIVENRNPIKTIAWLLVLTLLPVIGLIFFYFLGQDTRRMKKLSVKYYKKIKDLSFRDLVPDMAPELDPDNINLIRLLQRSNYSPLLQGTKIEIMPSGEKMFNALLKDMDEAKHHIHMEFFIFYNDDTGQRVKEMLIKKAREGIEVRFIYDNVVNWFIPKKFYKEMSDNGVQVTSFMKVKLASLKSRINYRNHRKQVIIDGHIGYTGGMNVADNYAKDVWRDTHLRMEGQGALGLQASFLIDWYSSGEARIDPTRYFPEQPIYNTTLLQVVNDGPDKPYNTIQQSINHVITTADRYVYIQTPYFLPPDSMFQALQSAALSGVDVRLMVSKRTDSPYVDPAAKSYYEDLLKAGMHIYEHQEKFVHAKTIVSDDMVSVLGSANMDFRSLETNFELNTYIYDSGIALRNREIFFEDLKYCKEISYKEWVKRPHYKHFIESIMRIFAPLM